DPGAAAWTGTVKLYASAKVGDRELRREVRPYTRVWTDANISSSRPTREFVLAVREGAPFGLAFDGERVEVEAGKKAELKLRLQRHAKDFTGKVTLLPLAPVGNLRPGNADIAAGKDEGTLTVDVPAGTPPGEYTV